MLADMCVYLSGGGGTAKFGRDRDKCSEIADVTVPYSNCSQSIKDSWFVSSSTLVPTKNAKSLTPLVRGTAKFGRDRDKCSEIADVTIPYSNTSQSPTHSWFVSSSPTKNAKSLTQNVYSRLLLNLCRASK